MKHFCHFALFVIVATAPMSTFAATSVTARRAMADDVKHATQLLHADSRSAVWMNVNEDRGQVDFATFSIKVPLRYRDQSIDAMAIWFLSSYHDVFGSVPLIDLAQVETRYLPNGFTQLSYQQHYQGVPIEGAFTRLILSTEGTETLVRGFYNQLVGTLDLSLAGAIVTLEDALEIVGHHFNQQGAPSLHASKNVITFIRGDEPLSERARLAIRLEVKLEDSSFYRVWIDRMNGELLNFVDLRISGMSDSRIATVWHAQDAKEAGTTQPDYGCLLSKQNPCVDSDLVSPYCRPDENFHRCIGIHLDPDVDNNQISDPTTTYKESRLVQTDLSNPSNTAHYLYPEDDAFWDSLLTLPLREIPSRYYEMLVDNGYDRVDPNYPFAVNLVWDMLDDDFANAYADFDTGFLIFHHLLSLPAIIGHEMTHWLLLDKSVEYDLQGIGDAIHEGMADVGGILASLRFCDELTPEQSANPDIADYCGENGMTAWKMGYRVSLPDNWALPVLEQMVEEKLGQEFTEFERQYTIPLYDQLCWYMDWDGAPGYKYVVGIGTCANYFPESGDAWSSVNENDWIGLTDDDTPTWEWIDGPAETYSDMPECHNSGRLIPRAAFMLAQPTSAPCTENHELCVYGIGEAFLEELFVHTAMGLTPYLDDDDWASDSPEESEYSNHCDQWMFTCMWNVDITIYDAPDIEYLLKWSICEKVAAAFVSEGVCDYDRDLHYNRADNCLFVDNPDQADTDFATVQMLRITVAGAQLVDVVQPDGVGDACDECPDVYGKPQYDGCPFPMFGFWPTLIESFQEINAYLDGSQWFAVGNRNGLYLLQKDDMGSPQGAAHFFRGTQIEEIVSKDNRLFVSGENLFAILTVDPESGDGTVELTLETTGTPAFTMRGDLTALSNGNSFSIHELSDSGEPVPLGAGEVSSQINDLAFVGGKLIAAHDAGLTTIDIQTGSHFSTFQTSAVTEISWKGDYLFAIKDREIEVFELMDSGDLAPFDKISVMAGAEIEVAGDQVHVVTSDEPRCVIYVDKGSQSTDPDGLSFESAFTEIDQGVNEAARLYNELDIECEVWVREGEYNIYQDGADDTLELESGVQVFGGFEGDEKLRIERDWVSYPTILSGQPAGGGEDRVHTVVTGADGAVLDGFVITGGQAESGGHVLLVDGSWLGQDDTMKERLENLGFNVTQAESYSIQWDTVLSGYDLIVVNGLALQLSLGAQLNITNSGIPVLTVDIFFSWYWHMYAYVGGENAQFYGSWLLIFGQWDVFDQIVRFIANPRGGNGAALTLKNGDMLVRNVDFVNNDSLGSGGAVVIEDGHLTVKNCRFKNNRASVDGGAISARRAELTIGQSRFEGNRAARNGGALHLLKSDAQISAGFLDANQAGLNGGAIYAGVSSSANLLNSQITLNLAHTGGAAFAESNAALNLRGVTCAYNEATADTGVVMASDTASVEIVSSIVFGNASQNSYDISGPANVSYSLIEDGFPGEGNIAGDPLFADKEAGDYRLTSSSPCIDTGFDESALPRDMKGKTRRDIPGVGSSLVDMGAFEF
ncbi:MAG: hypothetical protein GY854_17990 [Deltaproteobacteria bacterium]|nr:hypothetical protein [Deltaproteobacteria bacterium]